MADYQEIRDKMKEENCKRKEEERRNKPKLGLTEEQILTTICDYKRILDRVKDVADEIGFLTDEFSFRTRQNRVLWRYGSDYCIRFSL